MDYTKTVWENLPATTTAINAAKLNNIENGVDQAHIDLLGKANTVHTHDIDTDLPEATAVGRSVLRATDAATARTAIGAAATGAAPTAHTHDIDTDLPETTAVGRSVMRAADALAARNAIGAAATSGVVSGGQSGPLTVASYWASQAVKDGCDYACAAATDNQVEINQALIAASRGAHGSWVGDGYGGTGRIAVELVGPTFVVGNTSASGGSIKMPPNTTLKGQGMGTLIVPATSSSSRAAIELLDTACLRVEVKDLTIADITYTGGAPQDFIGHGIAFYMMVATQVDMATGGGADTYNLIENVTVIRAGGKGIYCYNTGTVSPETSYPREMRVINCVAYNCAQEGIYVMGSDCQITGCRSTGGGAYARFRVSGGNGRLGDCKAYTSGGDGFSLSSGRISVVACDAQDCAGDGFDITGDDVIMAGCQAESNGVGFRISANGMFDGLSAVYRSNGVYPQNVGIILVGTPKLYLTGRVAIPSTGTAHVSGAISTASFARVVRDGAGSNGQPQDVYSMPAA
jgi:Right handed beta helix region